MNRAPLHLLALATLGATIAAQSPAKTPPWWGVQDEVTVSLYWDFNTPFPAGQPTLAPTLQVVPSWYNNPVPVTAWTAPSSLTWIAALNGHVGVLGLVGTGTPRTALLTLKVDNDPHLDWVKIFQYQFDSFKGASGNVKSAIEQDLAQYKRTIVSQSSVPLPNGWEQVTIEAQLIPQPGDEAVDWTLTENALGSVGIDNLFVSSKCVKVDDDANDAMGKRIGPIIPMTALTGLDCVGVAVTEGPAPLFQRRLWVGTRTQSAVGTHSVLQIDDSGPTPVVIGTTLLTGNTFATVPRGPQDLAVETIQLVGGGTQQVVRLLVDRRPSGGPLVIRRIDAATGVLQTAADIPLALPLALQTVGAGTDMGLAFDPSGNVGAGSYWISATDLSNNGLLIEFSRNGTFLDVIGQGPTGAQLPSQCSGLGYDEALGNFFGFSQDIQPSPSGQVQVNGFEVSGYDFALTGNRFCGDLTVPVRGGVARGLDVYRSRSSGRSELRLVCLVEASNGSDFVYELAAPFGFGWSQFGRCRMRGGLPFLGSNNFQVALTGVPDALFGMMYLGFSNTNYLGLPLPLSLTTIGMPESSLSISLDVSGPLMPPTAPGEFVLPISIPPNPLLGYAPVFFQWVLLDPNVPGFMAASQAGKTVIYP